MKYLKRFNEELKASTYKSAADKLTKMGHKRRGGELLSFATRREDEEKQARLKATRDEMARFEPFNIVVEGNDERSGRFFISASPDVSWLGDAIHDWIYDDMQYGLSLSIEFGIMPADEETEMEFKDFKWSPEQWEGISWPNRMYFGIDKPITPEFEAWDRDIFYFTTRADAMRFKTMMIEMLEGKIEWWNRNWYKEKNPIQGIKDTISDEAMINRIEKIAGYQNNEADAERIRGLDFTGKLNYQNIIDSAKNIRINSIYRD